MELGIGKLLEMFEQHFGPRLTKVLLAIIAIGIAALTLKLVTDAVAPIVGGMSRTPFRWPNFVSYLTSLGLALLVIVIAFAIFHELVLKRAIRAAKRANQETRELQDKAMTIRKEVEASAADVAKAIARGYEFLGRASEHRAETDAHAVAAAALMGARLEEIKRFAAENPTAKIPPPENG